MDEITPSFPEPAARSKKALWIALSIFLGIAVIVILLFFQQGGYLKSQVLSTEETTTQSETNPSLSVDDYTKLETHCQNQKEAHISHCGERPPEEDYACRITEADHHYQECLTNTTPEEIEQLVEEEELLDEELEEDLLLEGDTEAELQYEG